MIFDEYVIKSRIRRERRHDDEDVCNLSEVPAHPKTFRMVIDALAQNYIGSDVNHVVTIAPEGLVFAGPLAYTLGLPLTVIRRARWSKEDLEEPVLPDRDENLFLGADALTPDSRALVVDDQIRTGEALRAATTLVNRAGGQVHEVAAVVTLAGAGGVALLDQLEITLYSLVSLETRSGG